MLFHCSGKHATAVQIHIPITQWIGDRFADGFESGEVDHTINRPFASEGLSQNFRLSNVSFDKR